MLDRRQFLALGLTAAPALLARPASLHPDGRSLWVGLGSSAGQIAVVDVREPAHPRLHGHVRPPFLAHDVGFSSGRRVWVTAGREPRIALVDTATRRPARILH